MTEYDCDEVMKDCEEELPSKPLLDPEGIVHDIPKWLFEALIRWLLGLLLNKLRPNPETKAKHSPLLA